MPGHRLGDFEFTAAGIHLKILFMPYQTSRTTLVKAPPNLPAPKTKEPGQLSSPPAKSRKRRRFFIVLLLVLLGLGGLGLYGFITFQAVKDYASQGATHLQNAASRLKSENATFNTATLREIKEELGLAEENFKRARNSIGWFEFALPVLGLFPGPGYDGANLVKLLTIATDASRAAGVTLDGVAPALAVFDNPAPNKLILAAKALARPEAQARFKEAGALVSEVGNLRLELDASRLGLEVTSKALAQLDEVLPSLREGLELSQLLPPLLPRLLGETKDVNYLTLLQNSDELRATGGFISSVGVISLKKGSLTLSNFGDSYAIDNPKVVADQPPPALARYMGAQGLFLRDANWWPDFPNSAQELANLYEKNQVGTVDGVIALDSRAVAYLFEALGPVELAGYGETLTAQNFEERLRYYYLPPLTDTSSSDWWLKRKDFTRVVMQALFTRLNGAGARNYLKVASSLGRAAAQKHLELYLKDTQAQALLTRYNLDGAQRQAGSGQDYLMVVDTNVGYNKVNSKIVKEATYHVAGAAGGASIFASLTLTYTNRAGVREGTAAGSCLKVIKYDTTYESMMNGCYWNYLRVYVPPGSQLGRVSGGYERGDYPTVLEENNKTVFATQLIIPPGQSVSLTFEYTLPFKLSGPDGYDLLVQTQAGNLPYNLNTQLTLAGRQVTSNTVLDRDVEYTLKPFMNLLLTFKKYYNI